MAAWWLRMRGIVVVIEEEDWGGRSSCLVVWDFWKVDGLRVRVEGGSVGRHSGGGTGRRLDSGGRWSPKCGIFKNDIYV